MTIIKTEAETGHYYTREGEPAYGAGMREVRAQGLIPSTTTIQSDDRAWALEDWKMQQVALECWVNHRAGEGDHEREDWARARVANAREVSKKFAIFGSQFHDGAEAILNDASWDTNDKWLVEFDRWVQANVVRVHWTENCLVHHDKLFAGRADVYLDHQAHGPVLIDFKTRKLRQLKNEKYSCSGCRYDKDAEQLASYADCMDEPPQVMNLYIHRDEPAEPVEYVWKTEDQAHWLESFLLAAERWTLKHKYDPRTWKPAEVEEVVA